MKYRTGEMAEFFGMTKEGIRFLERKGMIVSKRDERNGYRYFSRSEVSLLKRRCCSGSTKRLPSWRRRRSSFAE